MGARRNSKVITRNAQQFRRWCSKIIDAQNALQMTAVADGTMATEVDLEGSGLNSQQKHTHLTANDIILIAIEKVMDGVSKRSSDLSVPSCISLSLKNLEEEFFVNNVDAANNRGLRSQMLVQCSRHLMLVQ